MPAGLVPRRSASPAPPTPWPASVAKKEGYVTVAKLFAETADMEFEHAKRFYRFLESGDHPVTSPITVEMSTGSTAANLRAAAGNENHEHTELYPAGARTAREEGFPDIAAAFEGIAQAEAHHEQRFRELLARVEDGTMFLRDSEETYWYCQNCGYMHKGKTALKECPACLHPQSYFRIVEHF
eukprot:gnl/Ergobibamus_cyprinoides/1148.p1 GENE.gnl/Ergobibamus_cyprinoides/1148~~gnl/Ergobibamus_cyprinoides/1148.p1  ORF type:complete len:183 (+),score=58.15 gnl/Ergobibamus_cyprinoides/1148:71-619(+)